MQLTMMRTSFIWQSADDDDGDGVRPYGEDGNETG
jgi:hypothetical protein